MSILRSLHHLRAAVCDLASHMGFLPECTFTFLLSAEMQKGRGQAVMMKEGGDGGMRRQ